MKKEFQNVHLAAMTTGEGRGLLYYVKKIMKTLTAFREHRNNIYTGFKKKKKKPEPEDKLPLQAKCSECRPKC